ncbi:hypothetical protein TWF694_007995 [Orbilia ellipsospora]|uniref:Cytochrome P450 n=1 Tax=Orbilia ellipsospora TaxID=2528407 RepID=A0AAV9XFR3_9PEZI
MLLGYFVLDLGGLKFCLFAVAVLATYFILNAFYQLYFSPLAKVPGPWYTSISRLWLLSKALKGGVVFDIYQLHQKYGPFVRVAPNEISVADIQSVNRIHDLNDIFPKAKIYETMGAGLDSITVKTDHEAYKRRRRAIGNVFSNSNLNILEPVVRKHVVTCVQKVKREITLGRTPDLLKWVHFMSADIIGELSFGKDFGMLEDEIVNPLVEDMGAFLILFGLRSWLPIIGSGALKSVLSYIPSFKLYKILGSADRIAEYGKESLANVRRDICNCKNGLIRPSIFSKVLENASNPDAKLPLTADQMRDEAFAFMLAGSDTVVVTAVYTIWAILRHEDARRKLEADLKLSKLGPEDTCHGDLNGFTNQNLQNIPYLDFTIKEGLRLFAAVQMSLPRTVPAGNGGRQLGLYFFPSGTEVSTPVYAIHRDPVLFPDPHSFKPERWINATDDMNSASLGFGGASRMCIGSNLAMMEMRLLIAILFSSCPDIGLASSCTDESMEMEEFLFIKPRGQKCEVVKNSSVG